jgi:hypothetical protein
MKALLILQAASCKGLFVKAVLKLQAVTCRPCCWQQAMLQAFMKALLRLQHSSESKFMKALLRLQAATLLRLQAASCRSLSRPHIEQRALC